MMARYLGVVQGVCAVLLVVVSPGCREARFPNRSSVVDGLPITFHSVSERGETRLVYGFFLLDGTPYTFIHGGDGPPPSSGVHWVAHKRDGLWINGRQVQISEKENVIAILPSMEVVPVALTESEMQAVIGKSTIKSETLVRKLEQVYGLSPGVVDQRK